MVKYIPVKWKPVYCKSKAGTWKYMTYPFSINRAYDGKLLSAIVEMPRKNPISFDSAINLMRRGLDEATKAEKFGQKHGHYHWHYEHFVEFISEQGFHIQLTGDEFEPYFEISDSVA
jgi:hypothetical protein